MYNPQLKTFLCVAKAGSFNKAAEQLFITPTAVIKQTNLLESNLQVQLFERTHRGLKLTAAGLSLARDAKYIIQYCRDSVTRAQNAIQTNSSVIRIGISPITPAQIMLEFWPKIHAICPDLKFQLVPYVNTVENAREILANLGQNIDGPGFLTILCLICANAPVWKFSESRCAVRFHCTTPWPKKTSSHKRE